MTAIDPELSVKKSAHGPTAKDLSIFGLGGGALFVLLWALRLFVFHHGNAAWLLVLALYFAATGLFLHPALKPVYIGWTWAAHKIGWLNTRLILGIIFYLVMTPLGLLARLAGRDPLKRRLEPKRGSYWLPVVKGADLKQYEKEF
jgi:hypothetical protein